MFSPRLGPILNRRKALDAIDLRLRRAETFSVILLAEPAAFQAELENEQRQHDPHNAAAGNHLRLVGTPPCDTTVTVTADNKLVTKQFLAGSRRHKVMFRIDPGKNRQVKLHFSHCLVDDAKRKLAFLLDDTNLFMEQDTWGV